MDFNEIMHEMTLAPEGTGFITDVPYIHRLLVTPGVSVAEAGVGEVVMVAAQTTEGDELCFALDPEDCGTFICAIIGALNVIGKKAGR